MTSLCLLETGLGSSACCNPAATTTSLPRESQGIWQAPGLGFWRPGPHVSHYYQRLKQGDSFSGQLEMGRKEEEQIRGRHFHDLKTKSGVRSGLVGCLRCTVMEPSHRGRPYWALSLRASECAPEIPIGWLPPWPSCLVLPSGLHQHIPRTVCSTELLVMASGTLFKSEDPEKYLQLLSLGQGQKSTFLSLLLGQRSGYKSQQVTKNIQDWNLSLPTAKLDAYPYTPGYSNPMSLQAGDLNHSSPHPGLCPHTQPIAPCSNPIELSTSSGDGMAPFLGG